ncbi:MAG: hypothetical protein LBR36_03710 [Bacteroidales bacterium]|jgi:hypothetical protein|nr:hypothetical protein [Bacteroidales bacterium]
MNTDIDSYSLFSDSEPTDEQLLAIMQEVESDVRSENMELEKQIEAKLKHDFEIALAEYKKLYKWKDQNY